MTNTTLSPEAIQALHRIRLDRDLTYGEFAVEIGVSQRNLIRVMNDRAAGVRARTLHKINRYIDAHRPAIEAVSSEATR